MDIIERFKTGDKKSFELLFNQYFHRLCAFCYQYLQDVSDVEDLVQEAFISLWQKRSGFDNENAIKAYLYTSVRNKCLNHLKHQMVVQKHEQEIIRELEGDASVQQHVVEQDVFGRLYEEIGQLPAASQKIMLLVLKGMKNREIAEALNISENTVKTQKKIAYAKLKERIDPNLYTFILTL